MGDKEAVYRSAWRKFLQHRPALMGSVVALLICCMAIAAPWLAPYSPYGITGAFRAPPSAEHWLGTDQVGRDVWSRLIYSSRVSLLVGLGAVSIYTIIGTVLGAIAAYAGRLADWLIMRISDTIMSFPTILVSLVVVSMLGPDVFTIIAVIAFFGWPDVARLIRGEVLRVKSLEYVQAGVALGFGNFRIIFKHILPNVLSPLLVHVTFGTASAILIESGLSFLGFGIQPPTSSWGNMLTDVQSITVLSQQPWLWLPPGLMIVITVLALNFIGDGLRDVLDPKNQK